MEQRHTDKVTSIFIQHGHKYLFSNVFKHDASDRRNTSAKARLQKGPSEAPPVPSCPPWRMERNQRVSLGVSTVPDNSRYPSPNVQI